jgi:hypothetical protein
VGISLKNRPTNDNKKYKLVKVVGQQIAKITMIKNLFTQHRKVKGVVNAKSNSSYWNSTMPIDFSCNGSSSFCRRGFEWRHRGK